MALRSGVFNRSFGHEGSSLMNVILGPYKRGSLALLPSEDMEGHVFPSGGHSNRCHLGSREQPSPDPNLLAF
jgi:hypothetical protein